MKMNLLKASLVALTCITVGACSTPVVDNSQANQAQKQLEQKGVAYNPASFISCAGSGEIDCIKLFLAAGMDVNVYFSSTALSAASANGKTETVKYLLDNGANPNIVTFYGTALVLAVKNNHVDIVKILLAANANPNAISSDGHSTLSLAAFTGNPEVVTLLANAGAKVDFIHPVTGATPLSTASYYGKADAVRALIKAGANVNYTDNRGFTVLDWSQIGSYDEVTKILVENGATITPEKNSGVSKAMIAALAHQDTDMIKYLIEKGIDKNANAYTMPMLVWCAKNGLDKSAIELIQLGADINAKDPVAGSTALDYAVMYGEINLAKAIDPSINTSLVAANSAADPNLRTQEQVIQDFVNDQYYQSGANDSTPAVDYSKALTDTSYTTDRPMTRLVPLYNTGVTGQGTLPASNPASQDSTPAVKNLQNVLSDQLNSDTQLMSDLRNDPVFKNDASMSSDTKTTTVSGLNDANVIGSNSASFQDFDKQISQDMSTIDNSLNTPSTAVPPADQK